MPAILRNFVYQTVASLTVIGSTEPYGQGVDLSAHELVCNIMRCLTLRVGLYKIRNQ